jgi:uncharacterized protein YndB with AHSA1/START domain
MIMAEATKSKLTVELPSDTTIRMTRTFKAPKALLFEAHSKPEHLRKWWGQRDSPLSVCDIDFRVGGTWRFVQRSTNSGEVYGFHGEFREISPPDLITWTFEFEGMPGHVSVETIRFVEANGETTLIAESSFDSKEERDGMIESGMEAGAAETWDRLAELMAPLQ